MLWHMIPTDRLPATTIKNQINDPCYHGEMEVRSQTIKTK